MLIELIIAVAIIAIVLVGYLQLYIYCFCLAETSGNMTLAITEAQDKLEEIRSQKFSSIEASYAPPGNTFPLTKLNGAGIIYVSRDVTELSPDLLDVEIVINWRDKDRMIGGTDKDLDGRLDSPVELVSKLTQR